MKSALISVAAEWLAPSLLGVLGFYGFYALIDMTEFALQRTPVAVAPGIHAQKAIVATGEVQAEERERELARLAGGQAIDLAAAAARTALNRHDERYQAMQGD